MHVMQVRVHHLLYRCLKRQRTSYYSSIAASDASTQKELPAITLSQFESLENRYSEKLHLFTKLGKSPVPTVRFPTDLLKEIEIVAGQPPASRTEPNEQRKPQGGPIFERVPWSSITCAFNDREQYYHILAQLPKIYSSLMHILTPLKKRLGQSYAPRTVIDIGGGAGEGLLAAKTCFGSKVKGTLVTQRQMWDRLKGLHQDTTFMTRAPVGSTYDLVIASHILLTAASPRRAIFDAWKLVSEGGLLVFVETGSLSGFKQIVAARDALTRDELGTVSRILAPCPHEKECPLAGSRDICNFGQNFWVEGPLRLKSIRKGRKDHTEFSYVVIQRGVRRPDMPNPDCGEQLKDVQKQSAEKVDELTLANEAFHWPRIIRDPQKKGGHVTFKMCTAPGAFSSWTVPKSFGNQAYHDARKSRWGELWALGAKTKVPLKVRKVGKGKYDKLKDQRMAKNMRLDEATRRTRVDRGKGQDSEFQIV